MSATTAQPLAATPNVSQTVATTPSTIIAPLREWVTAILALLLVLGSITVIIIALTHVDNDTQFKNAKDVLLLVNPLLGLVIGFYFTKSAVEGRAEHAEASATQALDTAKNAEVARTNAENTAVAQKEVLRDAASFITDFTQGRAEAQAAGSDRAKQVLDRIQQALR